jgi:hypothetical protein
VRERSNEHFATSSIFVGVEILAQVPRAPDDDGAKSKKTSKVKATPARQPSPARAAKPKTVKAKALRTEKEFARDKPQAKKVTSFSQYVVASFSDLQRPLAHLTSRQ